MKKFGIYPGTFDPITFGHIDVIKRALKIVSKLFVAVSDDNSKDYLYDEDDLQNIEVGIKNFSVINIKFNKIDWLNLSHKGHERIIINFTNEDNIKFEWVAP